MATSSMRAMPKAVARYDMVMRHADRDVIVVVDMLETRDVDRHGKPGRLRAAKLARYDAPPGYQVCYTWLWVGGKPGRNYLTLNDTPQVGIVWDRRWLRWLDAD